jgi:hypothetical protein
MLVVYFTGIIRSGYRIEFVAQTLFALNVSMRAECAAPPAPSNDMLIGGSVELAFTSFRQSLSAHFVTE